VYFGYPQAHEDDTERAVRAGLELVAAVSNLKTHTALQTRVGIATGLVVVGDLIGSGASQEQAIVGETPNLAARLQGFADPNSVVIAESTRKLVGNLFELEARIRRMTLRFPQRPRRFRYRRQHLILDRGRRRWRTQRVKGPTGHSSSILTAA
jgi:class 3 adenylate cyclase